ncbi:hypothetical protein [Pseudoruegeria sp. SK021]|uniref:hypothetical protein n=1 Tax=Pseudoruegeria sp. SK021 TaxID=1933035 RepID=UPI000A254FE3|nr:hypothetical protein [Pseudoruegeria sp. SK021]OSP55014.1 hypothetical protein BV911_09275 [Pseudoruegeria sp. SK021]
MLLLVHDPPQSFGVWPSGFTFHQRSLPKQIAFWFDAIADATQPSAVSSAASAAVPDGLICRAVA